MDEKFVYRSGSLKINEPDPADYHDVGDDPYPKLTYEAEKLLEYYKYFYEQKLKKPSKQTIKVGEVLSSVAFIYERVRNSVDYKGEHLLMRNAIERILKRKIWEKPNSEANEKAETIITELIWAKYLKNDELPKKSMQRVEFIIKKYERINDNLKLIVRGKERSMWEEWFLSVSSCEVEEVLKPMDLLRIDALGWAMYSWFKGKFDWRNVEFSQREKDIQINIAVHRSLFKSDQARIRYHLLKHYYPNWHGLKLEETPRIIGKVMAISKDIDRSISFPVQPRLYRFIQKHTAAFHILDELINEDPYVAEKLFHSPQRLVKKIRKICKVKYDDIGERVKRGLVRSIIYIFLTKVILAILVEVPYDIFFSGELKIVPLTANVFVPPLFMFLIGLSIRKPGKENTKRIIDKISDFLYVDEPEEKFTFSLKKAGSRSLVSKIFLIIYLALFVATFGGISYLLLLSGFNVISGGIFFMFLSLVLLFGYRIRYTATELNVVGDREGLVSHMITNLTLPLLNLGFWLSSQLTKINIFIVILDFLIEAPLKSIMRIFEQWTAFIREKREEVVEVPV